jgi:hypothetical protein
MENTEANQASKDPLASGVNPPRNNYAPPASEVAHPSSTGPISWASKAVVALVGLQLAWLIVVFPVYWEFVKVGGMSLPYFGAILISALLLAAGAMLVLKRSRKAALYFCLSTVFGAMSLLSWRPNEMMAATLLAAVAAVVSWRQAAGETRAVRAP